MKHFLLVCCVLTCLLFAGCGLRPTDQFPDVSNPEHPGAPDETNHVLKISIGSDVFFANLEDSNASREFEKALPLTLDMQDLNGNEKFSYLPFNFSASPQAVNWIDSGDIMVFGSNCLVLFYESFSTGFRYTKLGSIADATGLKKALSAQTATVVFELGGN